MGREVRREGKRLLRCPLQTQTPAILTRGLLKKEREKRKKERNKERKKKEKKNKKKQGKKRNKRGKEKRKEKKKKKKKKKTYLLGVLSRKSIINERRLL